MPPKPLDTYGIGKTPEELQTALIDLRNDFDSHIHDGTNSRTFESVLAETLRARIISTGTPTGIRMVFDGQNNRINFFDALNRKVAQIRPFTSSGSGMEISATSIADGSSIEGHQMYYNAGSDESFGILGRLNGLNPQQVQTYYEPILGGRIVGLNGLACNLVPFTSVTQNLGASNRLWSTAWVDNVHYNTLTAISDRSLKTKVAGIAWGLKEIRALRPVEFHWKKTDKKGYGFIAQDVKAVIPDIVSEVYDSEDQYDYKDAEMIGSDGQKKIVRVKDYSTKRQVSTKVLPEGGDPNGPGLMQIDTSTLIPVLVKALQELSDKFDSYVSTHP